MNLGILDTLLPRPQGNIKPKSKVSDKARASFERVPAVKAWVLQQAKGMCELCKPLGPFQLPSGEYFLEVHHVLPLSLGGSDIVSNTVAVCPNCHHHLHLGRDAESMKDRLYVQISRLKRCQ